MAMVKLISFIISPESVPRLAGFHSFVIAGAPSDSMQRLKDI